jgi:hypothetical protein
MVQLATFFGRPLSDITYSNGATLICQGLGTLLWMYILPPKSTVIITMLTFVFIR